jgi:hypothetical protein
MSEQTVAAAAAAIAAHTAVRRVDDGGDPAGIGLWHLVASLWDYAALEGRDFREIYDAAAAEREPPLYLVRVVDDPGPCTTAVVVQTHDFEVRAPSLRAACERVIDGRPRGDGVARRQTRQPYTGEPVLLDPAKYAAVVGVRLGRRDDIPRAVAKARAEAASRPVPVAAGAPYLSGAASGAASDALSAAVAAAVAAVRAHTEALGIDDDGDPVGVGAWHLAASLIDYAEAAGVDLDAVVAEIEAERPSVIGPSPR